MPQRDVAEAGISLRQLRNVCGDWLVQVVDEPFVEGDADQGCDEGLGHREGGLDRLVARAVEVALVQQFVAVQHDERRRVASFEDLLERDVSAVVDVRSDGRVARRSERDGLGRSSHRSCREPVLIAETRFAPHQCAGELRGVRRGQRPDVDTHSDEPDHRQSDTKNRGNCS